VGQGEAYTFPGAWFITVAPSSRRVSTPVPRNSKEKLKKLKETKNKRKIKVTS
jgi:hypothetical protein